MIKSVYLRPKYTIIENHSDRALLIFIKNPLKGKIKTRLAKTVGDDKALEIYQQLTKHTRQVAQDVEAHRFLFYSHFIDHQDDWPPIHFSKHLQQGHDLGQRMEQAFSIGLEQVDKAVIIGSDCASLSPAIIERAFHQLDDYPFVIGPAFDGGYYLLGMNQFSPSLFEDMTWSTDSVFSETIKRIEALGQPFYQLETLSDIDTEEDWNRFQASN